MGLIKEILLLPVAPVRGTMWVAERIADQVEQDRYSGGAAVGQLDDIEEAKQRGELGEQEAAERQERILSEQLARAASPTPGEEG
jgi:hypothetical protein